MLPCLFNIEDLLKLKKKMYMYSLAFPYIAIQTQTHAYGIPLYWMLNIYYIMFYIRRICQFTLSIPPCLTFTSLYLLMVLHLKSLPSLVYRLCLPLGECIACTWDWPEGDDFKALGTALSHWWTRSWWKHTFALPRGSLWVPPERCSQATHSGTWFINTASLTVFFSLSLFSSPYQCATWDHLLNKLIATCYLDLVLGVASGYSQLRSLKRLK